jgi:hypothetical protein
MGRGRDFKVGDRVAIDVSLVSYAGQRGIITEILDSSDADQGPLCRVKLDRTAEKTELFHCSRLIKLQVLDLLSEI